MFNLILGKDDKLLNMKNKKIPRIKYFTFKNVLKFIIRHPELHHKLVLKKLQKGQDLAWARA